MRNKIAITFLIMISVLNISCAQDPSIAAEGDSRYQEYKNDFDKKFTDHFPSKRALSAVNTTASSSKDEDKNDLSLMLYQYDVKLEEVRDVDVKFRKLAIAKYKSSDSCLLIVNRFETKETNENQEILEVKENVILNKECYLNKYPIPNFVKYRDYNNDRALRLDDTFTIYVLDSKKVDSWEREFEMGPDPQMPDNWKNGYSKGVAVSLEKQTVIYWTVIW